MIPNRLVQFIALRNIASVAIAAGNSSEDCNPFPSQPPPASIVCVNSTPGSMSVAALDRSLKPQFYSSRGPGQCSLLSPFIAAPTFGIFPWGPGYIDTGEAGGGTSSTTPQLSGVLALLQSGGLKQSTLRLMTAVAAGAVRTIPPFPQEPKSRALWDPATGFGLLNARRALEFLPTAQQHHYYHLIKREIERLPKTRQLPPRVKPSH